MGQTGLKLSTLSFGSWVSFHNQFGVETAAALIKQAYDAGVNFFDNAEVYAGGESETVMGAAFRELGLREGSYVISSKFYWGKFDSVNEKNTLNRKRLMNAIDGSLERFGRECIDIVYCHRDEPETPVWEVVHAFHDMITAGKAHYWGTSEWSAARIIEAYQYAADHGLHRPVVEQPQYNLFTRKTFEHELKPAFQLAGIGTTTWSPLASGILTGKYNDTIPEDSRMRVPGMEWLQKELTETKLNQSRELGKVAAEIGVSSAQLAIAWCAKNPNVTTVILGASKASQLTDNLGALDVIPMLTDDVIARINAIFTS